MLCRNCNRVYNEDFNFCPHCGNKTPQPKICPKCNFSSYDFSYCPNCGEKLLNKEQLMEIEKRKEIENKERRKRIKAARIEEEKQERIKAKRIEEERQKRIKSNRRRYEEEKQKRIEEIKRKRMEEKGLTEAKIEKLLNYLKSKNPKNKDRIEYKIKEGYISTEWEINEEIEKYLSVNSINYYSGSDGYKEDHSYIRDMYR